MEPANIARLLAVLEDLGASYRRHPGKRLRPSQTDLSSPGHQLLMTRFGPLDVLGSIGKGRHYQDPLPHAEEMTIAEGIRIRVLNLETQIAVKEEIGQVGPPTSAAYTPIPLRVPAKQSATADRRAGAVAVVPPVPAETGAAAPWPSPFTPTVSGPEHVDAAVAGRARAVER